MAFVVKDRVKETTSTTGTGTITLAGASAGFQSFAAIGNGNDTYYTILNGAAWEVGKGQYTSSGTTLTRVLISSSTGSLLNLTGTSDVFCTYPAEKAVVQDSANDGISPQFNATNGIYTNKNEVATNYTIATNDNGMSAGPITVASGITVTVASGSTWVVL